MSKNDQGAQTPEIIYEFLRHVLDIRDSNYKFYDPCPHAPEFDGLEISWPDNAIAYVNPPYKEASDWIRKTLHEVNANINMTAVMLIPARTWTRYMHSMVFGNKYFRKLVILTDAIKFKGYDRCLPHTLCLLFFSKEKIPRTALHSAKMTEVPYGTLEFKSKNFNSDSVMHRVREIHPSLKFNFVHMCVASADDIIGKLSMCNFIVLYDDAKNVMNALKTFHKSHANATSAVIIQCRFNNNYFNNISLSIPITYIEFIAPCVQIGGHARKSSVGSCVCYFGDASRIIKTDDRVVTFSKSTY